LPLRSRSVVPIDHGKSAIAISPDDKTFYLTAPDEKEKKISIVSVDLASGGQKQVWMSPTTVDPTTYVPMRLAMSPDGRTLALVLTEGGKSQLVRVGVDGSGYRILYSAEGRGAAGSALSRSGLAWTNDGRSILFMDANKTGQRLLQVSADGDKPEFTGLVIRDIFSDVIFDLSPDGRTLAVHSWDPPEISR
jgi:dipeptidyl aminopeptidase/acylaminoacyl peptidase